MPALFTTIATLAAIVSIVSIAASPSAHASESANGYWEGAIQLPNGKLAVHLTLEVGFGGSGWSGSADIPQQAARGLPLGSIAIEADRVRFQLDGVPGAPTFVGKLSGDTIAGTFSQAGQEFPFEFARAEKPAAVAEAAAKAGKEAGEEAIVETEQGSLHGTLLLPEGDGPFPIGVIVAGSGPTDRNGNSAVIPGRNDSLKKIAELLQAHGIAALRYDKRGVGASAASAIPEADLRFRHVIDDVASWVKKFRGDPRFDKVVVLGHSEGSLAGMIAAREAEADAFVSLAGAGQPIDLVLDRQLSNQPAEIYEPSTEILAALRKGETVAEIDPKLNVLFRPQIQRYLISWIRLDPALEIARLKMPVMIVQGGRDLQVEPDQGAALRKAKPDARYLEITKMNHVLKDVPNDPAANQAAYTDPTLPLSLQLAEGLIVFLREALGP